VLPTRNHPEYLAYTLTSLARQDPSGVVYEVIVIDDGSEPPATAPPWARLIRHERSRGLNAARNAGIGAAQFDVIWFLDDDVELPSNWLIALAAATSRHPNAFCFVGPIEIANDGKPYRQCRSCQDRTSESLKISEEAETQRYAWGANFGVRRSAFDLVGRFDEAQPIYYDEIEWQDRLRAAGKLTVSLPTVWLWHRRPVEERRLRSRLRRRLRRGWGQGYYTRSRGEPIQRGARVRGIARGVNHAIRLRCEGGILDAAAELGTLAASFSSAPFFPSQEPGEQQTDVLSE